MVTLGGSLGPILHFAVARHSCQNAPPCPSIQSPIKAKAVPVAASSSEIASARPTGPELRPRSFTALRIQHSSKGASVLTAATKPSEQLLLALSAILASSPSSDDLANPTTVH